MEAPRMGCRVRQSPLLDTPTLEGGKIKRKWGISTYSEASGPHKA